QTAPERCHAFRFIPGFDQIPRRGGAGVFVFRAATGCASSLRGWTPPRTEEPHLYRVVRRRRGRRGRDRELASNTFRGADLLANSLLAALLNIGGSPLMRVRRPHGRDAADAPCQEIPGALRLSQPASPPDRGHV